MMSIGIKYGRDNHYESHEKANIKGREFHDYWMSTMSNLNCHELLDIDYPEELKDSKAKKIYSKENKCVPMCIQVANWLKNNL